jgi:hypothetical protein
MPTSYLGQVGYYPFMSCIGPDRIRQGSIQEHMRQDDPENQMVPYAKFDRRGHQPVPIGSLILANNFGQVNQPE